jgi:hypothetical protein
MSGCRNPWPLLAGYYKGPGVVLPGSLLKLGPVGLFNSYPFTVRVREATRLSGSFLLVAIYSGAR